MRLRCPECGARLTLAAAERAEAAAAMGARAEGTMEKGRLIWQWLEEEPGPVLSVVTWLLGWTALLWLALEEWR